MWRSRNWFSKLKPISTERKIQARMYIKHNPELIKLLNFPQAWYYLGLVGLEAILAYIKIQWTEEQRQFQARITQELCD